MDNTTDSSNGVKGRLSPLESGSVGGICSEGGRGGGDDLHKINFGDDDAPSDDVNQEAVDPNKVGKLHGSSDNNDRIAVCVSFDAPSGIETDGDGTKEEEDEDDKSGVDDLDQDMIDATVNEIVSDATVNNESSTTLPGAFRVTPPEGYIHRQSLDGGSPSPPPVVDAEIGLLGQQQQQQQQPENNNQPEELAHVPSAYLVEEDDVEIAQAKKVRPYFQRKEGQLTITIVGGLMAIFAIVLGVLLTRDSGDGDSAASEQELNISEVPSMAPSFDPRSTLDIVRDRGVVNCGIEDVRHDGDVNLGGFNIDQCRSLAATIFGDPGKVNLVIVGAEDRYERLIGGREIDVLYAGDTFTLEKAIREPTTGEPVAFGFPYYGAAVVYLGPETYVKCANEGKRYDECEDLSMCAVDTPEIRALITSFFPASFITFGPFPLMEGSLKNETCNVLVSDTYRIYGSGLQEDITDGKYVISDYHISRNLLSSVVRADDGVWYDLVEGSRLAAFRATQIGIKKNGLQCPGNSNNTNDKVSFYDGTHCVGNALEVFQEHLGQTVLSVGPSAYLSVIDGPNFGSLECETCDDALKNGRLKTIQERRLLNCAVYLDPLHNLTRSSLATLVNVKFCEILSVAIFQGRTDAVNISYIDKIDYSAVFPREFDIIAGASWEERVGFDTSNLGAMSVSLPYFIHDKYIYNGTVYDGVGLAISYAHDNADASISNLALAVTTATIYAQRQGITRASYFDMPLIHLLGNSLTFMLRDIVMYAGNYDDIINEAIAVSDGFTEKGWNTVVPNYFVAAKTPVYYCNYSGYCPPCQWIESGGFPICISVGPY